MISLRQVAVHNLKHIDLDLPLGKLIVFCGRSGSGKSSLAVDTLYAEGQRRYIETFSPAMRQFLEKVERPKAERLDGIPPSILLSSADYRLPSSLTVGDATEVNDYLAMLFAQSGHVFCPKCSRPITADTPQSVWESLKHITMSPPPFGERVRVRGEPVESETALTLALSQRERGQNTKLQIAFPPPLEESLEEFATLWKEQGFLRGCFNNLPFRLDEPIPDELYQEGLLLIVDRLTFDPDDEDRFIESLETAFDYGDGRCVVLLEQQAFSFSRSLSCEYCHVHVPPLTPKLFRTDWINHVHLHADKTSPTMSDLTTRTVAELIQFFDKTSPLPMGEGIIREIQSRLRFLHQVGLEYLTLSRPINTLSGGEQRRVALTAALGSSLAEMLYVLDEPSLGLHEKDTAKLLTAILELRDRGNTVILVEHDKQLLQHADHIIEIGPGAGDDGGSIVFQGSVEELKNDKNSLTGRYLFDTFVLHKGTKDTKESNGTLRSLCLCAKQNKTITLTGCTGNNLKNISATFPLETLCVVTGVSGAGKSSLIRQTLYPALCQYFSKKCEFEGLPFDNISVKGNINDVVLIDQTPMGRSSSSNPATYLKIFDDIRSVFAETADAKAKHITARHFSFNVVGGRCEHCKGDGNIVIDMQFLPDQIVPCPECSGKRYQQSVLDVLVRGKNIAEVLDMTAREAFAFFRGQSKLQHKLRLLFETGLDYLRLGQSSSTLSGGEAQRLRLAAHLGQIRGSRSLILMDEPTAGLHFADVEQMLTCFQSLIASGHSLIVIEHNEMVIQAAGYQIELGPGAGENGGYVL
ncbi:MAG: excinuclease ABC subunit UvrA [Planctomycetaceae bacterium]|nr:excinuclease ABC subunit UvrA [Planctomycetaceae bacterium]